MPPSDVIDSLNWDIALRKTYRGAMPQIPNASAVAKPLPIPAITVYMDSYVMVIGAKSETAKPHWYLAATVAPLQLFTPSSTSQFLSTVQTDQPQRCFLNKLTMIRFTNLGILPYVLEIRIPRWIADIYLEVWKYSGESLTTDALEGLTLARQKLDTIESKIDFINSWGNQ